MLVLASACTLDLWWQPYSSCSKLLRMAAVIQPRASAFDTMTFAEKKIKLNMLLARLLIFEAMQNDE